MAEENPYAPPESDVEVVAPNDAELATLGARFGGAMIDGIIGFVAVFAIMFATGMWERAMSGTQPISNTILSTVLWMGLFLLIHGYTLATRGQTLGKMIVGTRIVAISDGRILPLWKVYGLRYIPVGLVGYIPFIGMVLGLVNILLIFRKDRRCGHDLIAGTKVIKA